MSLHDARSLKRITYREAFLRIVFFAEVFFFGTLAPALRASDNPIAIACLRLVTFLPLPLLSVLAFSRASLSPLFQKLSLNILP